MTHHRRKNNKAFSTILHPSKTTITNGAQTKKTMEEQNKFQQYYPYSVHAVVVSQLPLYWQAAYW
eukprot:7238217-Ditylum_brightwellii.AAC.1